MSTKDTDLTDLHNIHLGRKCFICGAGPSIAFLKLDKIHEHIVMAVNSAIMLLPWGEGVSDERYWISNDTLCLKWSFFWKNVLRSNCNKLVRDSWRKYEDKFKKYGFRYFTARKKEIAPLENNGQALCSVSSVPSAIDLALLMGCNRIYLLGVDQRMAYGNSHFWQFWPKENWPQRSDKSRNFAPEQKHQKKVFSENLHSFAALKELAERMGVKIYNCSSRTLVRSFDKISLEEATRREN